MDYTGWAIFHTVVFYLLEIEGGGSNGCGATKGEEQKMMVIVKMMVMVMHMVLPP